MWLFKLHSTSYTQPNTMNQHSLQIRDVLTLLPKAQTITKRVSFYYHIRLQAGKRKGIILQTSLPIKKPKAPG